MTRTPTRVHEQVAARRLRNTAEPSGELSFGDVVAVGEIALAVDRPVGWKPVRGGLAEIVRTEWTTAPQSVPAPAQRAQPDHMAEGGHLDIE